MLFAGDRWRRGRAEEAWVRVEDGRLVEEGRGHAPQGATPAVMLDGVVNHHTHVGDAFLQGRDFPHDLEALVAPGTGLKHRLLAQARSVDVLAGMRRVLAAYAESGVADVVDFREGGLAGVQTAREALRDLDAPRLHVLGRPANVPWLDAREPAAVVDAADGLGLPSLADYGMDACAALRRAAQRGGKAFALHLSEGRQESVDEALSLDPDFVVHACAATDRDLRKLADAGIPVVVCPSSNAFFGLRPAVDRLERLGAPWLLGTDNAMLGVVDVLAEARRVQSGVPNIPDDSILRALTTLALKGINRAADSSRQVASSRLVVIPLRPSGGVNWNAGAVVASRPSGR